MQTEELAFVRSSDQSNIFARIRESRQREMHRTTGFLNKARELKATASRKSLAKSQGDMTHKGQMPKPDAE